MMRIVEALSGLPCARPLVSHPGQSLAIVGGSTLRQVESAQDLRMISRDRNEEQRGSQQPGQRERLPAERHPCHGCGHNHQRQTKVSEPNVNFLLPRGSGLTRFETLPVFLGGRHSLEDISAPGPCRAGALARRLASEKPHPFGRALLDKCEPSDSWFGRDGRGRPSSIFGLSASGRFPTSVLLLRVGKICRATGPSNLPLISFLPHRLQITPCPICSSLRLRNYGLADGLERRPHDRSRPAGFCRLAER